MTTICTSCGVPIPSSLSIYKCRQCVHHFVCQSCETKTHNRANAALHTLDKIFVPNVQPTTAATTNTSSKVDYASQQSKTHTSSKASSIFTSEEYFYNYLGYCGHCYRMVVFDKEPTFQCQQCPDFGVCAQCMPLMATHHPSAHTFSKQPLSHWATKVHDMYHLSIKCAECELEGFNGKRYQCEQCSPSVNLCENCFGKTQRNHKYKYIQNPLLHSINQRNLATRTLYLAKTNGNDNSNWRDPLTGWTKTDAEKILQTANQGVQNYYQIKKKIEQENLEEQKREREHQDRLFQIRMDGQRKLGEMQRDFSMKQHEANLEAFRDQNRILFGLTYPRW